MNTEQERERLIQSARRVVAEVERDTGGLAGACVVSSVAAGDFTPASDVDLLMVNAADEPGPGVERRLIEDRVFEWLRVRRSYFAEIDTVLAHPGLVHDILTAVILIDNDGRLSEVQRQVRLRYTEPQGIWERTKTQLAGARRGIDQMRQDLRKGETLLAQRAHVATLKSLLGLPRSLQNERCTMTRAVSFCREAAAALAAREYLRGVLKLLGGEGLSRQNVSELYELALSIVQSSGFSEAEKAIRARHLQGSQWLLENTGPADAAWPLYFWSSSNVAQAGGEQNQAVWAPWLRLSSMLGVGCREDLHDRAELASHALELAVQLADEWRPKLELASKRHLSGV